ncbi:MAG: TIR domain-containing protein [Baekduia sp.]
MYYHVRIWPSGTNDKFSGELYALNISESDLRSRFIQPYESGTPVTWEGRTVGIERITVSATDEPWSGSDEETAFAKENQVTNDWITGPPGAPNPASSSTTSAATQTPDPRRVMVVHGRNDAIRRAMFTYLRALSLSPIEWDEAIAETGQGTPHNLLAVEAAMAAAQAVVVVMTAEDQAGLLPGLASSPDDEDISLRGQPRQNVILEAGMAMGVNRDRTILVEVGRIRPASDFDGLNTVRLNNSPSTRKALAKRLESAGCPTNQDGSDWLEAGVGGDFETDVIGWSAKRSSDNPEQAKDDSSLATSDDRESPRERQTRAPSPPGTLTREERHAEQAARYENILDRFLERHAGIDQAFSSGDLLAAMDSAKLDEVWAQRALRELEQEGRIYRNPDGPGWYPTITE